MSALRITSFVAGPAQRSGRGCTVQCGLRPRDVACATGVHDRSRRRLPRRLRLSAISTESKETGYDTD